MLAIFYTQAALARELYMITVLLMTKYNIWFFSSLFIALIVALPIITVFFSFFNETSNYFTVLKNTFLFDYIFNSIIILFFVIIITFIFRSFICIFCIIL